MASREKIAWGIVVVVLVAVSVFLGVTYPIPPAPPDAPVMPEVAGAAADRYFEALRVGKSLQVDGNANVTGTLAKGGTPVALQVGALAGGRRIICGQTVITGTGTLPHGLATPQYVQLSLATDVTGNGARLSFTNASATVTAKVWNSALTPEPATTPVPVSWCVIGVP